MTCTIETRIAMVLITSAHTGTPIYNDCTTPITVPFYFSCLRGFKQLVDLLGPYRDGDIQTHNQIRE